MNQTPESPQPLQRWLVLGALALFMAMLLLSTPREPAAPEAEIAYTRFKSLVVNEQVQAVDLRGPVVRGRLRNPIMDERSGRPAEAFRTRVPDLGDPELMPLLEEHGVDVRALPPETGEGGWGPALVSTLPWLLLIGFYIWFLRRTYRNLAGGLGGRGDLKQFLEPETLKPQTSKITFEDVAGQENAKREVSELVDYLRHPEQFRQVGAEVPRGVLLMGPPGTGKTLMAKALAGEAGVPFYTISASEFIEVFVGVGAARVRRLFEAAKKSAPSIIFIDELDSIGRTRGTGLGGGHDEREQTLNQILAELDGFTGREAVIVVAATNRPDVLDPALLRPGRFDRHVTLDLPDRRDRLAILEVHTRKVPLAAGVALDTVAAGTPGFSGADLKNLVNEAAILAARQQRREVTAQDFDEARDRLLMGAVRTLVIQPEERHRLAVHEAGHTLAAHFLPHADPLYKVTIIPRGQALGGTQQLPEQERHTLPEEYLHDRLAVILAGRTAEQVLLGSVSSGADDDIRQATNLARAMVARWGMSESVGPVDLRDSESHPFLGREIAQPRHFSEHSAQAVDEAVHDLLQQAEARARKLIEQRREALERLIGELEEHETLERAAIDACLGPAVIPEHPTGPVHRLHGEG
ncbi:ATP-dependent zinc metalloprotease FtsH [Thioalbus denitrificans]|uniref:ATP-dependent zinc metalloprotease FtsH n=1 Tax=Thioalbus denitrificans TaxID=547122 RepID=A0A369BZ17_9GAMM|nr:ATP-dependent zinc metalloprotease FtsH [Thioalbus denitrificans]RCX24874.1 cell division protease FtsH [Thioalbus denitrificans]